MRELVDGDADPLAMMSLLAHMGGIDEIGVFVVPVILALFALRWAEKRARRREAEEEGEEPSEVPSPESRVSSPESSE